MRVNRLDCNSFHGMWRACFFFYKFDLLFLLMIRIVLQSVNGHVAYNGNPTWYANGVPSGTTQATISATTLSTSLTFDFVAS